MTPKYNIGQSVKIVDVRDKKGLPKYPELKRWVGKVGKVISTYSLVRSKNRFIYNVRIPGIEMWIEVGGDDALTKA